MSKDQVEYNYAITAIIKICDGNIFYSVDDTSQRYHSNLTNLPSPLRQFVTINGKHLTNIDLKNSQPFLSILLLTKPGTISKFAKNHELALMLESLQVTETEDIKQYVSLVCDGTFYEFFWKELSRRGIEIRDRKHIKKIVLITLFSKNKILTEEKKIFTEIFPEVDRIFKAIRGDNVIGNKFQNYKRFPILLQRIESYIILDVILDRINLELPKTIAVSIHDSILTSNNPTDINNVKKIMLQELEKFVGFPPKLKIENDQNKEKEENKGIKQNENITMEKSLQHKVNHHINNSAFELFGFNN
jgi:hypothetical protein